MMMIKSRLLLVAAIFIAHSVCAQPYYFRHYQVENGLSNNAVICSLQDKKGFLWFGTKDGLNRFDGYTFKIFRSEPDDSGTIRSNFIHSLYEDNRETLWVGTENGLYAYDATAERFSLLKDSVNQVIRGIDADNKGNLWYISGFTLSRYSLSKKTIRRYNQQTYFEATSVCTSPDGTVWASTSSGLLEKYDPATDSFTAYDVFSRSRQGVTRWIESIYSTANGSILIGTSNQGAKLFDIHTAAYKDILTYNVDRTEIFVRNFIQTSASECWMATESGIFIYNMLTGQTTNLRKKYNDPYSIADNAVYTFCKDREGGIWASTYFGGINYYPRQYTPFSKTFPVTGENSLSGNVVREIHQDHYGNLWIGTEDAGLNKLDTKSGRFTHFEPTGTKGSISYTNIHGLLAAGEELWIGTFEHGLDVMNIGSGKVIRRYNVGTGEHALNSNFIYCIYQSGAGDIMLGTTRGAYRYNRPSDDFTLLPGLPVFNWYSSLLQDGQGVIWAGTYGNGVHYYDPKTKKGGDFSYDARNKNSLSSDRVNSIFEDSNHILWFATEAGLCRYNKATNDFKRYSTRNGFPSNFIVSMLEDNRKNLWISTSKGLVCFNGATEQVNVYTRSNGLLNDQFNFSSAYKDAGGRMYFGSVKGMISFHPDQFIPNHFTPPVYITGFQLYNTDLAIAEGSPLKKSITYTNSIQLDHNQSTFSIDFAALSYTAPEMIRYAYKMDRLDHQWTYLKRNVKANFTELPPGKYTFIVKASNNNGVWTAGQSLKIEILPPFWASFWAYCMYIIAGLVLAFYLMNNYHRRTEEKNRQKIELLEIAKEKEIFEAKIEFFTNIAHEIRTPLTLIKGPLEKVMRKAAGLPEISASLTIMERNTNRLVDLTNQLLDFRQTEIKGFSLNFVDTNISELLQNNYQNFKELAEQKNLVFRLDEPDQPIYATVDPEALNKILANIFSNAVKYARSAIYIHLQELSETGHSCTIQVRNDGYLIPDNMKEKIFEPFFRLKETDKQKGTGIGLALSRSLTQLHKGCLEMLETENAMNVFSLTLPLHQENGSPDHEKPSLAEVNTSNETHIITGRR